jgi:Lon-like protease
VTQSRIHPRPDPDPEAERGPDAWQASEPSGGPPFDPPELPPPPERPEPGVDGAGPSPPSGFAAGRPARRWSRLLWIVLPVVGALFVLRQVTLPYYVFAPGPADDVTTRITIEGHPSYPTDGRLLLTSVTYYRANVYQLLRAWIDPAQTVVPEHDLVPAGSTQDEEFEVALSQMDTSKIDAAVVALTAYADYPDQHGAGVLIEDVLPGGPSDGKLFAGDLIVKADGKALPDLDSLRAAIAGAGIGGTLLLTVEAGGKTRTVLLEPEAIEGIDGPAVGIAPVPNFPFEVAIDSGQIGGPSAGLMWTLGLIEELTPGDLTDGRVIAGTGTIAPDGTVGPIGGIEEKVVAAERAGATIFFAPDQDAAAAEHVADHIVVVPVSTYQDAVDYLEGAA